MNKENPVITFELLASHPYFQDELAKWMFQVWGQFYPGSTLDLTKKWVKKTAQQSGLPITLLALDGSSLAGFAMVQRQELVREKGMMPWLGGLLVKDDYKGQGIGTHLNDWARSYLKSLDYQRMYVLEFDYGICEWYKNKGWAIKKTLGSPDHPIIIMENLLQA
jgi:predicted N-acetyltransferase YhbS